MIGGTRGYSEVALLAEGVDRNRCFDPEKKSMAVALLAEGVDRNLGGEAVDLTGAGSPSSRGAWIEICAALAQSARASVALLAEGVDRNAA